MARKKTVAANIVPATNYGVNATLIDEFALKVVKKLQENKFEGLIVGGGIRDLLLNKPPKDFDVVTDATPEDVRRLFKRNSIIIGKRFRIVHVIFERINYDRLVNNRPALERHIIEISTYRSLKTQHTTVNELGRIVSDNSYGMQSDDALRRDFTVNALYYDPIQEVIIDYSDGLTDIKNHTLRMIGEPQLRYTEDPVRILRALRLSIKLNLQIEAKTLEQISASRELLSNENRGRLFEEMLKILMSGYAHECVDAVKKFKLPSGIFPIFDKVFFGKTPDPIALKVLDKTDSRLRENNNVSAVFILSGMMWHMLYELWQQKFLYSGADAIQGLYDAIDNFRDCAVRLGVPRNIYNSMTYIWRLQFEFENPTIKNVIKTTTSSRFRQGLHLYNLRMEFGEVDGNLNQWWNKFIELHDGTEKLAHLDQLQSICGNQKIKTTRSSKKS
jgi:poly(A) polymerase